MCNAHAASLRDGSRLGKDLLGTHGKDLALVISRKPPINLGGPSHIKFGNRRFVERFEQIVNQSLAVFAG